MNDHRTGTRNPEACTRVRGRLEALLDGALSPLDRARDEGHLEGCVECAAARDGAAAFLETLRSEYGNGVDPSWRDAGLAARLAAATPPRQPWSVRLVGPPGDRAGLPVLAAAAAVLALIALGSSGAVDDLTMEVREQVQVTDGELRELLDGATRTDRWFETLLNAPDQAVPR
ncbi:zf-HC2 domain-containing protein [Engelhardtia mirabilis]|uniref:Putative zinc-finger domain-containing protein n=1 Tax=Engelhardtia mirabilis TaxID=2528011 RepID=A0A518BIW6_9BACT|nr:hypothetical protein Pla133_20060 [Planctomycetes bacterium Pla133]QDV01257.1 hypothetical protein Pla86_20060 [Planctomycetes bacterium Pla86]